VTDEPNSTAIASAAILGGAIADHAASHGAAYGTDGAAIGDDRPCDAADCRAQCCIPLAPAHV